MSNSTRTAASCFCKVCLPKILVRTGPCAGKVSVIVSDWKRTTASVIIGWNTPDAPFHGSVRSSYWRPNSFKPSVYAFSQSLREFLSFSMSPAKSPARVSKADWSISSAKLSLNVSSSSSPGRMDIAKPGPSMLTSSGSMISISTASSCSPNSSMPWGCW